MFQYSYDMKSTIKESGEHNTMNTDVALGMRIVNFLEKIRDAIFSKSRVSGVHFYPELDD